MCWRQERSAALGIFLSLALVARHCCSSFAINNFNPFTRLTLREQCDARFPSSASIWADDIAESEGHGAAARVFDVMLNANSTNACVWMPKMKSREALQMLSRLVVVLNDNTEMLGGWTASLLTWPKAATTGIVLAKEAAADVIGSTSLVITQQNNAITATELWINNTLCGLGLCPYTASMTKAAIGLDSVDVSSGPIIVRHASSTLSSSLCDGDRTCEPSDAVILGASFWNAVLDLARLPETEVATFLLIAPNSYNGSLEDFLATCDNLLERSCKAVGADSIIGKAWFHPFYNSSVVGHDSILPGHALPARMVKEYVDRYYSDVEGLDLAAVSRANDAVRHTPHATVNLLRRSQLIASKDAEAASLKGKKQGRPNFIYAQNVRRMTAEI